MEEYTTGTGQKVLVHDKSKCEGTHCCVHNPSDHHMKDWPTHWRDDRLLIERICEHGVGHPDPDDLAFKRNVLKWTDKQIEVEEVHGCDGCCFPPVEEPKPKFIEIDFGKENELKKL